MRLDAAQMNLPAQMLTVDLTEISDEKGVLVSSIAGITVDVLDARFHSLADQLLRKWDVWRFAIVDISRYIAIFETEWWIGIVQMISFI